MKTEILKKQKGITLIELVVAMTIFVVATTIAIGAFVSIMNLQNQTYTMTNVQQNGRILLEQISRLSRSADEVYIYAGPNSNFQNISFRTGTNNWLCLKAVGAGTQADPYKIKKYDSTISTDSTCASRPAYTLTSSEVKVNKMLFTRQPGVPPYLQMQILLESTTPAIGSTTNTIDLVTTVVLGGAK